MFGFDAVTLGLIWVSVGLICGVYFIILNWWNGFDTTVSEIIGCVLVCSVSGGLVGVYTVFLMIGTLYDIIIAILKPLNFKIPGRKRQR
jgi:hypothetical protein